MVKARARWTHVTQQRQLAKTRSTRESNSSRRCPSTHEEVLVPYRPVFFCSHTSPSLLLSSISSSFFCLHTPMSLSQSSDLLAHSLTPSLHNRHEHEEILLFRKIVRLRCAQSATPESAPAQEGVVASPSFPIYSHGFTLTPASSTVLSPNFPSHLQDTVYSRGLPF